MFCYCRVNALTQRVMREGGPATYEVPKADTVKKVMVIGGGPGGMEAARIAAEEEARRLEEERRAAEEAAVVEAPAGTTEEAPAAETVNTEPAGTADDEVDIRPITVLHEPMNINGENQRSRLFVLAGTVVVLAAVLLLAGLRRARRR